MKRMLAIAAVACALAVPAKAEECAYRLLTFPGNNGSGFLSLFGVEVGDVLLSVTSVTTGQLGYDLTSEFFREIQVQPGTAATPGLALGVFQLSTANLSAQTFVALICRRQPGVK